MTTLFEDYLNEKKAKGQSVKVYLKATQKMPGEYNKEKVNNLMLTGEVKNVDATAVVLKNQECFIPFSSILSIKPA